MQSLMSHLSDLPRMEEIYAYAHSFMAAHGNPHQWGDKSWPPRELLARDIEAGKSYVCLSDSGRRSGCFYTYSTRTGFPLRKLSVTA